MLSDEVAAQAPSGRKKPPPVSTAAAGTVDDDIYDNGEAGLFDTDAVYATPADEASAPAAPQNCEQFAGCFLVILRRRCDDCRLGFPETNLSHSGSVRNSDGRLSFERVNYSTGNHMHAEVSF